MALHRSGAKSLSAPMTICFTHSKHAPLDLDALNHAYSTVSWWRHQKETFSALLALCEGIPPVTDGFPSQRSVTLNFDVFFDLRRNKRLSKQSRRRWCETPSPSLWRQCNVGDITSLINQHSIMQSWVNFLSKRGHWAPIQCEDPLKIPLWTVLSPQWDFLYW